MSKFAREIVHDANVQSSDTSTDLHFHQRGTVAKIQEVSTIDGYDHEAMKSRTLLTYEEEKKLLRRVDWRLMPLCALIFMIKNIDANNAANAKIMNKGTPGNILAQLKMTSDDYNFVSTIYFIPFIVFEIPATLVMKKMLPSRFQARIIVTWGVCLATHAAATTKHGLYTARFFLGLFEAGMFPGIILQLTYWYRPDELTFRLLIFYSFEFFAQVISAVLAFGFDNLSGRNGLSGWQWFFLVEGVVTIAFGVVVWFLLPDFPAKAKWLTETEKAFLEARLPKNAPRAGEMNFNWREIVASVRDIRLWLFTLVFATKTVSASGLLFYLPTIVNELKLTTNDKSQLLTIPTSVAAILLLIFATWVNSHTQIPLPLTPLAYMIVATAMYGVLFSFVNTGGVYAATIIAGAVSSSWYPIMWQWRVQTTERATGAAFAIAFSNSLGQIGTLVGPQIFRQAYAPRYHTSFAICIGVSVVCVLSTLWAWWLTRRTEEQTRLIRRTRLAAAARGDQVLDDINVEADVGFFRTKE